jgi:flavin-dependent dehydrogenase
VAATAGAGVAGATLALALKSGGLEPVSWRVAVWNGVTWMIVKFSSEPGSECTSAPLSRIFGVSPQASGW